MTTPGASPPDGSFQIGNVDEVQDITETSAKAMASGGVKVSFTNVQNNVRSTTGTVIPNGSPLWQAWTYDADTTVPRMSLVKYANDISGSTANDSGGGTHNHGAGSLTPSYTVPDYKPAGHGANDLAIGFIAASKDRVFNNVTFITGNDVTALGIAGFHIGVYRMAANGNLTLAGQTGNLVGQFGSTRTEYRFALNSGVTATKGEIFGIGLLQVTNVGQTCNSYVVAFNLVDIVAPPNNYPRSLFAEAPGGGALPGSIAHSSLEYKTGFCPWFGLY